MAWQPESYLQFPDEAAFRHVVSTALGVDFPASGAIPTGNQNYALHAPMAPPWAVRPVVVDGVEVTPGIPEPGYWAMLRLNDSFEGYAALDAAIEGAGVKRDLVDPNVVFAS